MDIGCLEVNCPNVKWLCFTKGCLMRSKEEFKEYMNKYRFCKILERYKQQRKKCEYCDNILETLHHRDENHNNNRLSNLLPVCHKHHLEIEHNSDHQFDILPDMPFKPSKLAKNTVTTPKSTKGMLENCNISRFYNVTLINPTSKRKANIIEGSKHLVELLSSLGFVEVHKQAL